MNPIPTYKVMLVGSGGVGKTTFLQRAMGGPFDPRYIATLGVEVHPVRLGGHLETRAIFNVWDCAGQERFDGLGEGYHVQAQAVILAFDLTSRYTFKVLAAKLAEVRRIAGDVPFIILGLKNDLPREVTLEEVLAMVSPNNYVEVSSKMGGSLTHVFEKLEELLL